MNMRSFLPFLQNWGKDLNSFSVVLSERKKTVFKGKKDLYLTLTTCGIKNGKKFEIYKLDSGIDNVWGGVFESILRKLEPLVADSKSYKWKEIKKVILDYYHDRQKASIREQKRQKAKTIYTPAGDFTLWQVCKFLTYSLDLKYKLLKNKSLFSDLKNKKLKEFDMSFSRQVLQPIFEKNLISEIINSKLSDDDKAIKIVDIIVDSKIPTGGLFEDVTNPEYEDPAKLLSSEEERELNGLWQLYEADEKRIKESGSLSSVEKRLEQSAFWESPQGNRLNSLNRRRVRGGMLTFEEKEIKKRQRAREISESLFNLLSSLGLEYGAITKGLDHYQVKFEFATMERWKKEKEFRQMMDKGKLQLEYLREIVEGKWDSDSVNLFGVIVGVSLAVGLGVYSLVSQYKLILGIGSAIASITIYVLLHKSMCARRIIIRLMRWTLK